MKKNEKFLIVGISLCLLVGVIGYSFSYFASKVNVTGSGSETNIETADFANVEYDAGSASLALTNAVPGSSASKEFYVNITPTDFEKNVKYNITLNISTNGFTKCSTQTEDNECTVNANELVVTLKRKVDSGTTETLVTNKDITASTGDIVLRTEDLTFTDTNSHVYTYTIEVSFINTGADQNHNVNKSLAGTINVNFAE